MGSHPDNAPTTLGVFGEPMGRRTGWLVVVPRCPEPLCRGVHHHRVAYLEGKASLTVTRRCPKTGTEYTIAPADAATPDATGPGQGEVRTSTGGDVRTINHGTTRGRYAWLSRDEWAARRRTCYADDVDKALDAVSDAPAAYATPDELIVAVEELHTHWRQLGHDLRAANAAARAAFPRFRPRQVTLDYYDALDALPADQRATVDHAVTVRDQRARIHDALREITNPDRGRLSTWVTARILTFLPDDRCPTWRSIVEAWQAARRTAATDYREQVTKLPVDDAAWAAELERRDRIDASRSVVWTGEGIRYAS